MLQNDSLKCCLRFAGPLQCYQGVIKKLLVYPTVTWKAKSRVDKPWGVKRNWKLSLTLGCTSSVTNKASRLHALLFFFLFTLASLVLSQSRTRVIQSSFCYNIFGCCKMLRVFCQPLHNIFNTIQQCYKTFRWNVACVWPGLYNATKRYFGLPKRHL